MEEALYSRVLKRHENMVRLRCAAGTMLAQGAEIELLEVTKMRLQLKHAVDTLERETHIFLEKGCNQSLPEKYLEDQIEAEELVASLEALELAAGSSLKQACPQSARLPKLELPKYNGDILKWTEFWDLFEANIHCRDIKEVDKLSYLLCSLEGTALQTVHGLGATNENYKIAVDTLKRRYGSRDRVVDAHYDALNKISTASNAATECRQTLNEIEKHIRILSSLGEDVNSGHLRVLISSKFPSQVMYQVKLLTKKNDIQELRSSLSQVVDAMEHSMPPTTAAIVSTQVLQATTTTENRRPKFQLKRKPERATEMVFKRARKECAFCRGNHFSDQCRTVSSIQERKRRLHGKCFVCLRPGHNARICKSKKQCFFCKGHHNSALCLKKLKEIKPTPTVADKSKNMPDPILNHSETLGLDTHSYNKSYLQTATAWINNKDDNLPQSMLCRLLLDCGSQRSYITTNLAKRLHIEPDTEDLLIIYTFGSETPLETTSPATTLTITTKRGVKRQIRVNIVTHITEKIPIVNESFKSYVDILADDESVGDCINLLIGNDYYFSFIQNERLHVKDNLHLVNSDFGWIVSGNIEGKDDNDMSVVTYCQCYEPSCSYLTEADLPLRDVDMKFLWALEGIGITDSPKTTREEEAVEHFNNTVKYVNGRYEIKWPWVQFPPDLPTNYNLALGRLKSLLRRSDERVLKDYSQILREHLDAQIIELVEPITEPIHPLNRPVHFLPHHIVRQTDKGGRIVYDASAKLKDRKSLNECMFRGPSMLEDLTALLLKFRCGKIGITADIEKAFLQVGLQKEDKDVTRFLWVKDPTKELNEDNLLQYRFCRVPFGIVSSPFLLTATIRFHMSKQNSALLENIADKCYVDNLVTCAENLEKAVKIYQDTRSVFHEMAMNMRDWVSNDKNFMETIPQSLRAKNVEKVKVLGLVWDVEDDTLQLKAADYITAKSNHVTKKDVLRTLARIYDPCGFVSPLILPAKILFQELCVAKYKWDTDLSDDYLHKWNSILDQLRSIAEVRIPRCVLQEALKQTLKYELHTFTDASKRAYAAVTYLRIVSQDASKTAFLMSKARVTPVEDQDDLKIPRLELLAYLIGSRLLKYVKKGLDLTIEKQYLWTDSLVVLSWVKSNKLLPPFVARRVNEIKQNNGIEFRYVNTNKNPADLATRPELWEQKKGLWFAGPEFLNVDSRFWPKHVHNDEERTLLSVGEALDIRDGPEVIQADHAAGKDDEDRNESVESIKKLQAEHFHEEVSGKVTHLTRNLGLYLDVDGLLRCRGRLANTNWTYDMKHPILLPKQTDFTDRIIKEIHEKNYHVGVPHTLSLIREKYWIPQGRAQIQKILRRCQQCIKYGGGPYRLPTAPSLPAERVNYSTPFTYAGVDYFGPVMVNTNAGTEKRWVCLFTCLAVRAIHMEIVRDLTAEECLLALRRIVASRGLPYMVVSDNALYFKLTSEVLSKPYCVSNNIKWKFIPQLAPWHGGFYERLVALVKHCMKRTLDKHLLHDSQLLTVIKEIELVINKRPLTYVGTDLDQILRPVDFLTLGKCLVPEPLETDVVGKGTTTKIDLIASWKRGNRIIDEFKNMFTQQYLTSLREKYKHAVKQPRSTVCRSPQLGDIVQIKDDSNKRVNWKVGKITSLLRGHDGQCRVARVNVEGTEFTRSVGHLYPLEAEAGENEGDDSPTTNPVAGVSRNDYHLYRAPDSINIMDDVTVTEPQANQPVTDMMTEVTDCPNATEVEEAKQPGEVEMIDSVDVVSDDNVQEEVICENAEVIGDVETEQDPSFTPVANGRPERGAALRAREKIAEWTRHLVAIL